MRECDDQYPWLGEFLTEYVDGTMSPAARSAFEECLRGNPELARFVERLQMTRQVLCGYGCDVHAPCNLREQLHARLLREGLLPEPVADTAPIPVDAPAHTSPAIRVTLVLMVCAMGAALFAVRAAPEEAPVASETRLRDLRTTPSPTALTPISARVLYGEPRVPTRADSMRRAEVLAAHSARMVLP